MVLKISVLESGAVLLDGEPAEQDRLDEALQALKAAKGTVWYYREPTAQSANMGRRIIQRIVAHKLPVSISSKPDFSDYLDAKGVSHPRSQSPAPRDTEPSPPGMPAVAPRDDIEEIFAKVRQTAAGEKGPRGLVVVRPDRGLFVLPALAETPALNAQAAGIERLIPSAVKRNIAVIADTGFTSAASGAPSGPTLADANRAVPFFGMLVALSYIGHYVWVFEGHATALAAGCRDADVLLVDSAMLSFLEPGWEHTASAAMRNANILAHDRSTFKLRFLRKVGDSRDAHLEFR